MFVTGHLRNPLNKSNKEEQEFYFNFKKNLQVKERFFPQKVAVKVNR